MNTNILSEYSKEEKVFFNTIKSTIGYVLNSLKNRKGYFYS